MLRFSAHTWMLWLLYAGAFSDEDVNGCEHHPCQNGGVCQSHGDGFRCLCSPQSQNGLLYGGATCTTALSGCDGDTCDNGGTCSPLLVDGEQTSSCLCPPGFTGPRCRTSTIFSFESRGFVSVETPLLDLGAPLNVTFSFRAARPGGTLMQRRVGNLLLSIELTGGHLSLWSRRGRDPGVLLQELPLSWSNHTWYTVEATLGGGVSLIRTICTEGNCTGGSSADVQLSSDLPDPGGVSQGLIIGAGGGATDEPDHPPPFLGCFRDVFVGSKPVLPAPGGSAAQVNVTAGCSHTDWCAENPCQNRGRCISHGGGGYTCECHRPYEGGRCAEESITARFGGEQLQSYAVFSLDGAPGDGNALTVSMFVRTRQPGGLLLVLTNSTSQFVRLWLEGGRVKVQVNNFETLVGHAGVSDGHFHLVTVKLEAAEVTLFQSTQRQGSLPIRRVQVHHGDLVFVGGLPDPRASASFGGYFKGCVQDLRINSRRLQFYPTPTPVESHPLQRLVGVTPGCGSDDACAVNPCLNGGACYPVWDDFICSCPPSTAGLRCEEVKWCELSPCPAAAACQPRPQGFECLSNVTFRADSSVLRYRSDGTIKRRLSSLSLSFRTRRPAATLLHGRTRSGSVTVSLVDSRLVVELRPGATEDPPMVTIRSQQPISDGAWHTLELHLENQTLQSSRWVLGVDGGQERLSTSKTTAGGLDFLREGADIFLGGLNTDAGVDLSGCLGPVEVGGLLLPFLQDTDLNLPRPQEEQFVRVAGGTPPRYGCWGADVCRPNPCRNAGRCDDLFDLHRCTCPPDWTGPLCEASANACTSNPCLHGNCTDLPGGGFGCACEAGRGGDRCQVEVDACENSWCNNGSTCLKGLGSYSCLCPPDLTGQYCDEKIPEIPWYIQINPRPQLPATSCVGTKLNYSCFNGGNCSGGDDRCSCLPGFTGVWCEKDVDECASDPCLNGGFCVNYVNGFECVCDMNYSGVHCQMDVSDFYLYVFLGLWQNLFQLVSYLVMRLDDEPEIEWGFYVND
ncbi:protein crumbs homolog 1-like [Antennarius striatus]|uniref:protein crumbs homolog 1-like n=1 Tax=Antennarius striatus TaxID=241820 RepID=UPI0035B2A588